jgi:hypothetical protein
LGGWCWSSRLIGELNEPAETKPLDVNMPAMLSGRKRTQAECGALLKSVGLRMTLVLATASPQALIEPCCSNSAPRHAACAPPDDLTTGGRRTTRQESSIR